jgi:methionine-gamma-lyase
MGSKKRTNLSIASVLSQDVLPEGKFLHPHNSPLYLSSTYLYGELDQAREVFAGRADSYIYGRWEHPNARLLEDKLAFLDKGESELPVRSLVFSSGMAAIHTALEAAAIPGSRILAQGNLYGTTADYLISMQHSRSWEVQFFDPGQLENANELLRGEKPVSVIYLETPANPTLAVYDIRFWSKLAKRAGALLLVDNTFASSLLQQPLVLGADISLQSATKFLNGHGTGLGGVISVKSEELYKQVQRLRKLQGNILSPFDCWQINNGLKTLILRMEKHQENALRIARFLEKHSAVSKVNYPGLSSHPDAALVRKQMKGGGGVLSFELIGGKRKADRFLRRIELCRFTASLGTPDTLVQHPASMSHVFMPPAQRKAFGITDSLVRISVGLESSEDLIGDLKTALE